MNKINKLYLIYTREGYWKKSPNYNYSESRKKPNKSCFFKSLSKAKSYAKSFNLMARDDFTILTVYRVK